MQNSGANTYLFSLLCIAILSTFQFLVAFVLGCTSLEEPDVASQLLLISHRVSHCCKIPITRFSQFLKLNVDFLLPQLLCFFFSCILWELYVFQQKYTQNTNSETQLKKCKRLFSWLRSRYELEQVSYAHRECLLVWS